MLHFNEPDKKVINDAYQTILFNLVRYLQQYNTKSALEYSKIIINMLHSGLFSIQGTIEFSNGFKYLGIPSDMSEGIHVMYGICCCRHATEFLYNLLYILNFRPSFLYVWVDNTSGTWRRVNPAKERANHIVLSFSINELEYLIDPANNFILQKVSNNNLELLDIPVRGETKSYQDPNIEIVGKVLRKYYTYRDLGVEYVY